MVFLSNILSSFEMEQNRDSFEWRPMNGYISEWKGINYLMSEHSMGLELLTVLMAQIEGGLQSRLRASPLPVLT